MLSQCSERILVITCRQDIAIFLKKNVEPLFPVYVTSKFGNFDFNAFRIILYDMSLFLEAGQREIDFLATNCDLEKMVFMVTQKLSSAILDKIYSLTRNIIPYPCTPSILAKFIKENLISRDFCCDLDCIYGDGDCINEKIELLGSLLGTSKEINEVKKKIIYFSKQNSPVLLLGESGTGKTTTARIIHDLSRRNKNIFMPVNCGTFTGSLDNSALFGTKNGAYTDARDTKGYIRNAEGGTLFLDEIGLSSLDLQAKLLMFLDSGIIYSVGSDIPEKIDTRIILATNDNLKLKMLEGLFRKELYFRIEANIICIAPLRERREDIALIANFVAEKQEKVISYSALRKLEEYSWPGNVRQLMNCVNRAITTTAGEVISENNIFFGI